jgi:hypothetical protein
MTESSSPTTPTLITTLFYVASIALAVVVVFNASAAAMDYGALYEQFTPGNRADAQVKNVLQVLSLGLYRGASEQAGEIALVIELAETHELRARQSAWLLFGVSVFFLVAKALALGRVAKFSSSPVFVSHLLGVSSVFLVVGLMAPILSLVAYTDVVVLGKVVFKYESKGIITTVAELVRRDNIFIAAILFTFSVVTPLIKHVFTFLALRAQSQSVRERYVKFLSAIGKWSMADVLVVAIVLAFFVAGADEFSDSWLGVGLYFFTGYCLLSLAAVQLVTRVSMTVEGDR